VELSQGTERSQKVATSDVSLVDVILVSFISEDLRVRVDISSTFPSTVSSVLGEAATDFIRATDGVRVVGEVRIFPCSTVISDLAGEVQGLVHLTLVSDERVG
jgi:hypothetical protein